MNKNSKGLKGGLITFPKIEVRNASSFSKKDKYALSISKD